MIIKPIILIVILSLSLVLQAQNNTQSKDKSSNKETKKLPDNIEAIHSKFSFAPFYVNEYSFISIDSRKYDRPAIYYKPNVIGSLGATVGIKNFSFSYAFNLPRPSLYGKTNFTQFILNFQKRIIGLSLYFLKYKGLYLKNPEDFGIHYSNQDYPIRPDIRLLSFGFKTHFVFTKSFSINAAFKQNERQKKTAGSFMIMFGDQFIKLTADSSLIVPSEQSYYEVADKVKDLNLNTFYVAPGAGYTFVFKHHISFTTILLTGVGFQMKFYKMGTDNKFGLRLPLHLSSRSALGYNGEKWFANLIYRIELNNIKFTDSKFTLFANAFRISLGYRIY